ncbi:MAG TPA: hypothetical protein VIU63_10780 [Nitrospira sp.]
MSSDPIRYALKTPGHLRFSSNRSFIDDLERAGGRVVHQPTGHLVFYRADGRRFLATDPAGHPLHECEWAEDAQGHAKLLCARVRLDWGEWVGIKPAGLVNETTLNLATKPGWQRLTADDLRAMAAQSLRVPSEEVRWFYRDEDFSIDQTGRATIRHRKDALYRLEEGDFDRARFMSCMGAMHWSAIDFLPVVELFKSLLPGTGSAVFELIRGLYDDQGLGRPTPLPLRYRGIPTYPSEAAFRLFSAFFTPQAPRNSDACSLFMNPLRAHEVTWLPSASPPLRYFDAAHDCCATFQAGALQKITLADDTSGLPYVTPKGQPFAPYDRSIEIVAGKVVMKDRHRETILHMSLPKDHHEFRGSHTAVSPVDWRSVFVHGLPPIPPCEAYGAVLLYPQDETEIGELAAQPFVADYLQDLAEQDREIGMTLARAERVSIENGDAVIAACVAFDRPRDYKIHVRVPAFAQKQAQQLWSICAGMQRWDWLTRIRMLPIASLPDPDPVDLHELAYYWIPYAMGVDRTLIGNALDNLGARLRPQGHAFVVGPADLETLWPSVGFRPGWQERVEELPTFRMHRSILPKARLRAGLTLYYVSKI